MAHILLIEDDEEFQALVQRTLSDHHQITCATNLREANSHLVTDTYDLILLDVGLPDGSGFDFMLKIRNQDRFQRIPVLFLTGSAKTADEVTGLSLGADDYIVKPIEPVLLKARVEARIKRLATLEDQADVFTFEDLVFTLSKQEVALKHDRSPEKIDFTSLQFRILYHLAKHPDQIFSRQSLLDLFWGNEVHVTDRTVDVHISKIRSKLSSSQITVQSVYGKGYRLAQNAEKKQSPLKKAVA